MILRIKENDNSYVVCVALNRGESRIYKGGGGGGGGGLTQGTNLLGGPSMQSILELGGLGHAPPRKFLKNRC